MSEMSIAADYESYLIDPDTKVELIDYERKSLNGWLLVSSR